MTGWTTALHKAAYSSQIEAVRWLLEHGADPTLREETWGNLPRRWAGSEEIEYLLAQAEQDWSGQTSDTH